MERRKKSKIQRQINKIKLPRIFRGQVRIPENRAHLLEKVGKLRKNKEIWTIFTRAGGEATPPSRPLGTRGKLNLVMQQNILSIWWFRHVHEPSMNLWGEVGCFFAINLFHLHFCRHVYKAICI